MLHSLNIASMAIVLHDAAKDVMEDALNLIDAQEHLDMPMEGNDRVQCTEITFEDEFRQDCGNCGEQVLRFMPYCYSCCQKQDWSWVDVVLTDTDDICQPDSEDMCKNCKLKYCPYDVDPRG